MFLWLKTLYRKRAVTWPFIFYTIIWTLSIKEKKEVTFSKDWLKNTDRELRNMPRKNIKNKEQDIER